MNEKDFAQQLEDIKHIGDENGCFPTCPNKSHPQEKEPWEKRPTLTHLLYVYEGEGLIGIKKLYESLLDAERAELVNQIESALEDYCIRGMPVLDHKMMMGYIRASLQDTVIEKIKNKV